MHSHSWLSLMPDETYEIRVLLEEHSKRIIRKDPFIPGSGFLPLEGKIQPTDPLHNVTSPKQGIVPVRDAPYQRGLASLCDAKSLGKIKCIVRLKKLLPECEKSLKSFCKPNSCGSSFVYRFGVLLCDEIQESCALVQDSVGAKLFGMSASEAVVSRSKISTFDLTNENLHWKATLQSVEWNGARFIVLADIDKI